MFTTPVYILGLVAAIILGWCLFLAAIYAILELT
jgi:hypothetical protein